MKKAFLSITMIFAIVLTGTSGIANAKDALSKVNGDAVRYVSYTLNNTDNEPLDLAGNENHLRDWHCEWVDADGIGHDCTYIDVIVIEE